MIHLSFWLHTWYIECCVETFVHGEKVVWIVQIRQSWVLYDILTAWTAEQSTKIPAFPEFVASVLLLIVGLWVWPEVSDLTISLQEIVGSNTRRIEGILYARVLRTYCTIVNRCMMKFDWRRYPGDRYHMLSSNNRRYSRARSESWNIACVRIVL